MQNLEDIVKELNEFSHDVRAEALVYTLLQKNSHMPLLVQATERFRRNYSKDLYAAEEKHSKTESYLQISLARTGLYDLLPEGVFFQPNRSGSRAQKASEMAAEYKANKKIETQIRQFFAPLEQEFFNQHYSVFCQEADTADGIYGTVLNYFLKKLWELPKNMPMEMVSRMARVLPQVHSIAGNHLLMGEALAVVLDESVSCKLVDKKLSTDLHDNAGLGEQVLGVTSACGNAFVEQQFGFAFTIVAKKYPPSAYLPNGKMYDTLKSFYEYLIPVNAFTETVITVSKDKSAFVLDESEQGRIGISSFI